MSDQDQGCPASPETVVTLGPYRIIRRLGAGTTAMVFEVEHQRIARRAALKVLAPETPFPDLAARLVVEAQATNAIADPHIVEITDILDASDGQPLALVMELLDGQPLSDLMTDEQRPPADRSLRILGGICDGLAAVHAAGFVHRDVKPDNVFLVRRNGSQDFVKLLDFGLVKAVGKRVGRPATQTLEGAFFGSPAYASPEQAGCKAVDHRADLYAVGVVAYELLTGQLPFKATELRDLLLSHMTAAAPHLPARMMESELGRALDGVLQTCLAKDPAERIFSAAELAETFRRLAEREGVAGLPTGPSSVRRARRPARERRLFASPVAAAAFSFVLFAHQRAVAPERADVESGPTVLNKEASVEMREKAPAAAPDLTDDPPVPPRKSPALARVERRLRHLTEEVTLDPFK